MGNITLCCVDCVSPHLALRALQLSQSALPFAKTLLITDKLVEQSGIEILPIPTLCSVEEYSHFMVKRLADHISTSHVLIVQWDGYIINPSYWTDEFLEYDYIGAIWEFHNDSFRVGNGGFSLRSKRLLEALRDPEISEYHPEDEVICRKYRPLLEQRYGIRFSPEELAKRFSFETSIPQELPFGFHALHNIGTTISPDELPGLIFQFPQNIVKSNQYLLLAKYYLKQKDFDAANILISYRTKLFKNDREALALKSKIDTLAKLAKISTALRSILRLSSQQNN